MGKTEQDYDAVDPIKATSLEYAARTIGRQEQGTKVEYLVERAEKVEKYLRGESK